ncbi:uncharacterized protein LOC134187974 [Corticium candelabrum]|uniref:uncharacterized protein LOC134187974 n=1 Tax=Corticium candelabrum TaxID=121492 RepID=UPI002E26F59F|nr:uncharacterized protein LOC134187974 [Corticium candelabrum]
MAFTIQLHTGERSRADDVEVLISLYGREEDVQDILLDRKNSVKKDQPHLFHAGQVDEFKVEHKPIGDINVIRVEIRPSSVDQEDWFLEFASVQHDSGTIYTFPCNKWFSQVKGDGRTVRNLLRGPLPEDPRKDAWSASHFYNKILKQPLPTSAEVARKRLDEICEIIRFKNWGGTVRVKRVRVFFPTAVEQVADVIKLASIAGLKVRSTGSTHSWSMLYADIDQVLINPENMGPKDEKVVLNEDRTQVTIMTNATTLELKRKQLREDFNIMSNVILDSVTYGGTVNTGCHGVGKGCPALPDMVDSLELVNDQGWLVTYSKANDGEDFMKAVSTNLGLFGFVYKMTLDVEPRQVIVKTENVFQSVRDVLTDASKLKTLAEANWSTEIFWFPYNTMVEIGNRLRGMTKKEFEQLPAPKAEEWDPLNDDCWIRLVNEDTEDNTPEDCRFYFAQALTDMVQHLSMKIITPLLSLFPQLNPYFCHIGNLVLKTQPAVLYQQLPHAIHYRKFINWAPVRDMEFAFVIDDDYENIVEACQVVVTKIQERALRGSFPMNICLEMRFMSESTSLLCPAVVGQSSPNSELKTAYIEILSLVYTKEWDEFCEEVAVAWSQIGGKQNVKPLIHWAKEMDALPDLPAYIWANNGTRMQEFLTHLGSKVDLEKKLFFNQFLDGIFFPPPEMVPPSSRR